MIAKHDDKRKPRRFYFSLLENLKIEELRSLRDSIESRYVPSMKMDVRFESLCENTLRVNKMEERKIGRGAKKNIRVVA